jgi:hypothetical protein
MAIKIKVQKTIRLRLAKLDHAELTAIGRTMVDNQRKRWARGVSADNQAIPLKPRYARMKKAVLKKKGRAGTPLRDMSLFGVFGKSFRLRLAENNKIRAEATTRQAREHARRANRIVQMIGFSGPEFDSICNLAQKKYGAAFKRAVIRVGPGAGVLRD